MRATVPALAALLLAIPVAHAQTPPTRDPHAPGYVSATTLPDGTNAPPTADGNFILGPTHTPAPDMSVHPDVPHGKIYEFTLNSQDSHSYPGIAREPHTFGTPDPNDPAKLIVTTSHPAPYTRRVSVYVPAQYVAGTAAPFIVGADGPDPGLFNALDNLIAAHRVPAIVAISIANGGGDAQGSERGLEYDTMSGRYAEFVEHEVLPRVESEAHVQLTHDPAGRATMGGSSGGSAAFAMAWYHPDLYHRVLTYSGTYINQQWPTNPATPHGAAEFYQNLIPNSPRKPLRIWMEVGDRDLFNPNVMRDNLHDWVVANEEMAKVLAAKGYHYQFVFARNAGHVDRAVVRQTLPEALEYLWQGYPDEAKQASTNEHWELGSCRRASSTPILSPNPAATFDDPVTGQPVHWEALHTFNPAAILRDGKIDVLYRAEDNSGPMQIGMHTSRLGLAESSDGVHFTPRPTPVFYPAKDAQQEREWPGGTEDPRIVESPDGTYVLTYTQWNRKTYTVGIATSRDLVHWTKHGPAFDQAAGGKYRHLEYKSAGILTQLVGNRLVTAKIDGKYWMYWGEIQIRLATSTDLIHWTPVEDANGKPKVLLTARPGLFDSAFPEVGPPPLLTDHGIVLLYNGKNADPTSPNQPDPDLSPGAYSGGQALFSAQDPTKLLDRPKQPYIRPELPFEKTGQYKAGTIFTEGLVPFHQQWFLYYGAADSFVGVATCRF